MLPEILQFLRFDWWFFRFFVLTCFQKTDLRNWPRIFFAKTIYFQPNVDDTNLLWSQSLKQEPKKEAKDDHYWNTRNVVVIPVLLLILAKLSLVLSRSPPRLAFLASKEQSSLFFRIIGLSSWLFSLLWTSVNQMTISSAINVPDKP